MEEWAYGLLQQPDGMQMTEAQNCCQQFQFNLEEDQGCHDCRQESAATLQGTVSHNDEHWQEILPPDSKPASPTSILPHCSSGSLLKTQVGSQLLGLNNVLADAGFAPLRIPLSQEKLLHTLVDVVRDYARRETIVQELMEEVGNHRKLEDRNNVQLGRLEAEVQALKRRLAASEQRSKAALCAADKAASNLRKEVHSLELANSNLVQRCSQLEHICRSKERDARKYQSKLLETIEKEEGQRCKDMECYRDLKKQVAKSGLDRFLKPLQLVSIYEKQKLVMASEVEALRSQVAGLCRELQDRDNGTQQNCTQGDTLEQICKKLQLRNPTDIATAVESLIAVNAAVPCLEDFVEQVCDVVFVAGAHFLPRALARDPRQVPNILKSWLQCLSNGVTLGL